MGLDRGDNKEWDIVQDELGGVFVVYAIFLFFNYGIPLLFISIWSVLAAVMYFWVTVPLAALIFCVTQILASFAKRMIAWEVRREEMKGYHRMDSNLEKAARDDGCCSITAFSKYFGALMTLPLVQLLIITQTRLLDGYGYLPSIYLAASERHLVSYAGAI